MMSKFDKIFLFAVSAPIAPVLFFLAGWWGSIPFLKENQIWVIAVAGFVVGVIVDGLFLKRWLARAFDWKLRWVIPIYMFYDLGVFGFFMGVPVVNVLIGIIAGIFLGRRSSYHELARPAFLKTLRAGAYFTVLVMAAVCFGSAFLALSYPSVNDIRSMLNLPFAVTRPMVVGIVVVGGGVLLVAQYWITKCAGLVSFRK